jgi:hypothetical protein
VHSGYGVEAPQRSDLPVASGIARNETWYTNWVWDMNKTVQLSFEVDYRQTDFVSLQSGSGRSSSASFSGVFERRGGVNARGHRGAQKKREMWNSHLPLAEGLPIPQAPQSQPPSPRFFFP